MVADNSSPRILVSIGDVGRGDVALAGGKGANLGDLVKAGIPVPPAFIVTVPAYLKFAESIGLIQQINRMLARLDVNNNEQLERTATDLKALIMGESMPSRLCEAILQQYAGIGAGPVAVRSSATAEDLAEASFAGQQASFLNVEGEEEVVLAVQRCWASLFEPRAIFYRAKAGVPVEQLGIAVVVQRMVQSDCSGVAFTLDPVTNDPRRVVIEAVWGLGEAAVSGVVTPDMYVVDKASGRLLDRCVTPQEQQLVRDADSTGEDKTGWSMVPTERRSKQKLSDDEARELAAMARRVEEHFGCPQDIEWACEGGSFYIVQARPVTTTNI